MSANDSNKDSVSGSVSNEETTFRASLGIEDVVYQGLKDLFRAEKCTDLRITNNTGMQMKIKFYGTKEDIPERTLENGLTTAFVRNPRNGRGPFTTHNYECEFKIVGKKVRIYIYGETAPRKDNQFEATIDGIYLIEGNEKCLWAKWVSNDQ